MLRTDKQKEAIVKLWLSKKNIGHGYNQKYFCYENKIAPKTLNNYVRQYNEAQHVASLNKGIKNKATTDSQHPWIKNQVTNNLTTEEVKAKITPVGEAFDVVYSTALVTEKIIRLESHVSGIFKLLETSSNADRFLTILSRLNGICEHLGIITGK